MWSCASGIELDSYAAKYLNIFTAALDEILMIAMILKKSSTMFEKDAEIAINSPQNCVSLLVVVIIQDRICKYLEYKSMTMTVCVHVCTKWNIHLNYCALLN